MESAAAPAPATRAAARQGRRGRRRRRRRGRRGDGHGELHAPEAVPRDVADEVVVPRHGEVDAVAARFPRPHRLVRRRRLARPERVLRDPVHVVLRRHVVEHCHRLYVYQLSGRQDRTGTAAGRPALTIFWQKCAAYRACRRR
uniref:Uncharacterized protein n=1 Tax=Setaria italica TaxID=4555 RepID=K3ZXW3_SETIT